MLKLLVVEDEQIPRIAIVNHFVSKGWVVEEAATSNCAKRILSEHRDYDAVWLDRRLNGRSEAGDEVLQWIRAQAYLVDVCVVIVTVKPEVNSAVQALKLGAFHYLQRPVKVEEVESVLRAGVALHRAHKMRRELLKTLDGTRVLWQVVDVIRDALGSDRVHALFLQTDGSIQRLTSGGSSVDQSISVDESDRRFVRLIREGAATVVAICAEKVVQLDPIYPEAEFLIAVPVMGARDQVRGIIEVEGAAGQAFSQSWVDVLQYLADLVGIGVEIGREAERLKDVYRDLRHNIATHVQIVTTQARQMQKLISSDPGVHPELLLTHIRFIVDNATIVEKTIQDIKAIVAPAPKPKIEPIDVLEVTKICVDEQAPRLKELRIFPVFETGAEPVLLHTDRQSVAYSLRCLLNNATESIQDNRQQRLGAGNCHKDEITFAVEDGGAFVGIKITDTGIGFDENIASKLFMPLFSTKARRLPMGSPQESIGLERIERVLELMGRWCRQDPRSKAIPNDLGPGAELFIREGTTVDMYIGHRGHKGGINPSRLEETTFCRVGTDSPLAGEWRGRGEGLFSVQKYIARLGGTVSASSPGIGQGATFTITLPKFS